MIKLLSCLLICAVVQAMVVEKDWPTPPKWTERAAMARYLAHYADYGVISTISKTLKTPFGSLESFCDGPIQNSSGTPYFYMADMATVVHDLVENNAASLAISMHQGNYCTLQDWDPEDPRCAKLSLSGKVVEVEKGSSEYDFAKQALFDRHPSMKTWPTSHGWRVYKMVLSDIFLIDYFGGAAHISAEDYYKAKPDSILYWNNRKSNEI